MNTNTGERLVWLDVARAFFPYAGGDFLTAPLAAVVAFGVSWAYRLFGPSTRWALG